MGQHWHVDFNGFSWRPLPAVCRAGVLAAAECLAYWISTAFPSGLQGWLFPGDQPQLPLSVPASPWPAGSWTGATLSRSPFPWAFPGWLTALRGEEAPAQNGPWLMSLWAEACSCGYCTLFCQLSVLLWYMPLWPTSNNPSAPTCGTTGALPHPHPPDPHPLGVAIFVTMSSSQLCQHLPRYQFPVFSL